MRAELRDPASDASSGSGEISNGTLAAEAGGTGLLAFAIVTSGILAERYAINDGGFALAATALTAATSFFILVSLLAPYLASFFNPAIALSQILSGRLQLAAGLVCAAAQIMAAMLGVMAAHLATNTGIIQTASFARSGFAVWGGEAAAMLVFTFALLSLRDRSRFILAAAGALCLLLSTLAVPSMSFVNPALTLARSLTESFTALALTDAVIIAIVQLAAAVAGWALYLKIGGNSS